MAIVMLLAKHHHTAPHRIALHGIILYHVAPHCIALRHIVPHCTTPRCTAPHCIVSHRICSHRIQKMDCYLDSGGIFGGVNICLILCHSQGKEDPKSCGNHLSSHCPNGSLARDECHNSLLLFQILMEEGRKQGGYFGSRALVFVGQWGDF